MLWLSGDGKKKNGKFGDVVVGRTLTWFQLGGSRKPGTDGKTMFYSFSFSSSFLVKVDGARRWRRITSRSCREEGGRKRVQAVRFERERQAERKRGAPIS